MDILIDILIVFALLGLLDDLLGNKLGLAESFERGISVMGRAALSMIGFYCIGIMLVERNSAAIMAMAETLPMDPSLVIGCLLAPDTGGLPITMKVAATPMMGVFTGALVAGGFGMTLNYQLPVFLTFLPNRHLPDLMRGFSYGLVTLPVGLLVLKRKVRYGLFQSVLKSLWISVERKIRIMQYRILVIEDDTDINNVIADTLTKAGYICTQAFSGTEALLYLERENYALAVMDLMLPGLSGENLLPKLKEKQSIPVIVVSAKDGLDSKINMLTSGAEDYITKPFEIQELIARVGVQIRRFTGSEETPKQLQYKDLVLNKVSFTASVNGEEIVLTKQEFKILELLLSYPNKVFSKQDIYDYAWNDIYIGEDKTINVHISNIRKKLKAVSSEEYIETVWGIGFRLAR